MAQFPAEILLSSLDGTNGFQLNGFAAGDDAGFSVSDAGDINGDGFGDIVVGADDATGSQPTSGVAYVVFGKASGFAATIELNALDGSNGFRINGEITGDELGYSVSAAGDVNGDGVDDLVIGAEDADTLGLTDNGAAYVLFGKKTGFSPTFTLSPTDGVGSFKMNGELANDAVGYSVSGAGDVNGDGVKDFIIGAEDAAPAALASAGSSYVIFGRAGGGFGQTLSLSTLTGANGFKINGAAANDESGTSVSGGDVNGDGISDLIIGADDATPNGKTGAGSTFVVFGKTAAFAPTVQLSALDGANGFRINGEADDDASGFSVSAAGDFNGDGIGDFVIGAPYADPNAKNGAGAAYIVFGKATFASVIELSALDGSNGFQINGEAAGDNAGLSVSGAGDVNGDGFADVIIGAEDADPNAVNSAGASYVVFGKASGFPANFELSSLDGTNGFQISGEAADDDSGNEVSAAGDINNDGFADLIVGADDADPNAVDNAGQAYVILGRAPDAAVTRNGTGASQTISGGAFDDTLNGLGGNDSLNGNAGKDTLDGGAGVDKMNGGAGDDTYFVDDAADTTSELPGGGNDTVISSVAYTLGVEIETLTLTGTGPLNGTGNAGNNAINGNAGANTLDGGGGDDALKGGAGDDTYVVDSLTDSVTENSGEGNDTIRTALTFTLVGLQVENLVLTGAGDVNGTGNDFANKITGNAGANTLDGGAGADELDGGAGNDTYVVDNTGDKVKEAAGGGTDTVQSGVNFSLAGQDLENLLLTGNGNTNGTGNSLANQITGNAGDNTLDGAGGGDSLAGGEGDDTYVVDSTGDTLTEAADGGTDTVRSAVSFTLGANFENLVLTGTGNRDATGNAADNSLTGNAGNNTLDGGAGADTMNGGAGNDTYVVDDADDTVVEASGGGTDTVRTALTFSLDGLQVEKLVLIGTGDVDGTGNDSANTITGNSGDNTLDGGAGNDTLLGGEGDDTYVVDATADKVIEADGEGTDTVQSSASFTLAGQAVDNLVLTGTGNTTGIGNGLANRITGNSGNNKIDGAGGADTMTGGDGNDSYTVDNAGDKVIEKNGEGTDAVASLVSFTLGVGVDNLTLVGNGKINAIGNSLVNVLVGNGAANRLAGGAGNDTLRGGAGNDAFFFNSKLNAVSNVDIVADFSVVNDAFQLENGIFTALAKTGKLAANLFKDLGDNGAKLDKDDRIVYNHKNGNLSYDADGSGAAKAILFAQLNNRADISADDFIVV